MLCHATEFESLPIRPGEEHLITRLLRHAKYEVPSLAVDVQTKANALLQAHIGRSALRGDLLVDQQNVRRFYLFSYFLFPPCSHNCNACHVCVLSIGRVCTSPKDTLTSRPEKPLQKRYITRTQQRFFFRGSKSKHCVCVQVVRVSVRLLQAIVDVLSSKSARGACLLAMELCQMVVQAQHRNDSWLLQLPGMTKPLAEKCEAAGARMFPWFFWGNFDTYFAERSSTFFCVFAPCGVEHCHNHANLHRIVRVGPSITSTLRSIQGAFECSGALQ